jgi:hypothetical protein
MQKTAVTYRKLAWRIARLCGLNRQDKKDKAATDD